MKSLIKIGGMVVLLGLLIFFGAQLLLAPSKAGFTQEPAQIKPIRPPKSQDTTKSLQPVQEETYVSKVILQAPWAEKNLVDDGEESPPGEFGIHVYVIPESLKQFGDAPPPEGPTSFTIAPNGDIYITDPLNGRIQRFDANGNFISVIRIPPLERSKYNQESDSARMERLRRAGKLPKTKEPQDVQVVPKGRNWYKTTATNLICVDRSNNVYLIRAEGYTNQSLYKYDQQGKLLATYPLFPEVRIGGGDKLYCDSSDRLFLQYSRRLTDKIILSLKEWDSLRGSSAPFAFQIGTADRVFTPEEQKATLRRGVLHETPDTRKIKEHAWKEFRGKFWGLHSMRDYDYVDEKGNLYHFCSTKQGIIISKWYKP